MENLRNRTDIKLIRPDEERKIRKLVASPLFSGQKVLAGGLAAIHMHQSHLTLNNPVYTGMTILENSKILMYDFYYNFLKKEYGDRCELIYTDTDSLLLEIETKDVYADIGQHANLYDTSDYPPSHPLHSVKNKKVLGKMKDEMAGEPIAEVVCLRPKMYSILRADDVVLKKAKDVKSATSKKISATSITRNHSSARRKKRTA